MGKMTSLCDNVTNVYVNNVEQEKKSINLFYSFSVLFSLESAKIMVCG